MSFKEQTINFNHGKGEVEVRFTWIKPSEAREMLFLNTRNRSIRPGVVRKLKRDIKTGKFEFTGDTIRFAVDKDGNEYLADGQHRLEAIAAGGQSVPVIIVRYLQEDVTGLIDQASPRAARDIARMEHGDTDVDMSVQADMQAIARLIIFVCGGDRSDRREVAAYMHDNKDGLKDWAVWARHVYSLCEPIKTDRLHIKRPMTPSAIGALGLIMVSRGFDEEMVRLFFVCLAENAISENDDSNAITALRSRWKTTRLHGEGKLSAVLSEFDVYVRAYCRWINNEPLQVAKSRQPITSIEQLSWPEHGRGAGVA